MSDLEFSKTTNLPEVPLAGEIDEYDPEQMLRQFYINCDALALYNKLESFEFDVSEVLQVCASARHPEIYRNIIKKISAQPHSEITFYLMQMIHIYVYCQYTRDAFFEFLLLLAVNDLKFSLHCTWFLEAYLLNTASLSCQYVKNLANSILTSWCDSEAKNVSCFVSERSFITELILISRRLQKVASKRCRIFHLHTELLCLDRSLSTPVFIPIPNWPKHVVVRIPYKDSSILNSKDKVPYLLYLEVIEDNDISLYEIDVASYRVNEFKKFIKSHKSQKRSSSCDLDDLQSRDGSLKRISLSMPIEATCQWRKVSADDIRSALKSKVVKDRNPHDLHKSDDPSAAVLSEPWKSKIDRIRESSPYGNVPGWKLYSIIVKYGDDLRQDYLAYQFLKKCQEIWTLENVKCWVRPYYVLITESQAGIIEAVTDAMSIHQIKGVTGRTLEEHFRTEFGYQTQNYTLAKKEFIKSLAGYSLFQYIFQVKDRHNGNILMDLDGHIIHIDFGFVLGQSPKGISFETSPFKISYDFLEIMEGTTSDFFLFFKSLMFFGYQALRKHSNKLINLVEIMTIGETMPCLAKKKQTIDSLKARFHPELNDDQLKAFVEKLVYQSTTSLTTLIYDKFQYYTNGIRI